jgi:hypothetical protein
MLEIAIFGFIIVIFCWFRTIWRVSRLIFGNPNINLDTIILTLDIWKSQGQKKNQMELAKLLIQEAKSAVNRDTYDPFDTNMLLSAIAYYRESHLLIENSSCLQAIDNLQIEIDRRHRFQALVRTAVEHFQLKQFRQAVNTLLLARELYAPQRLIQTIAEYQEYTKTEDVYLQSIADAKILSYAGKFREALTIVNDAVAKFPNPDGENLKFKLSRVIAAKEQLSLGNIEQKISDLNTAKSHYLAALTLMPEWSQPKLKLAIVETQSGQIDTGIERLASIDRPQVKYLEGLLHVQKQQYQIARAVWSKLDRNSVQEYSQILARIAREKSQLWRSQIRQLVEQGDLERAKTLSLDFLDRFGSEPTIENNLHDCILPGIEASIWNTRAWDKIAIFAKEQWLKQRNIKSLHNWAIALHYSTQVDDNIEELIIAWSTAIANIDRDPMLQDLPWLGTQPRSLLDTSNKLWALLELRIDAFKDTDLPRYLHLRDLYRQEFWAMALVKTEPTAKVIIDELIITPGCYQHYYSQITLGEEPQIWQTLYTNWGKAVAACLAGDPQRAETIKIHLEVNSSLEEFAKHFVFYEQGCDYLQQEDWRSASHLLNRAKNTIDRRDDWCERIEILCTNYRSRIRDLDENLEFARFWSDLLTSPQSAAYAIEYRALKIQDEWQNSTVSDMMCLIKIRKLLDDYPEHLVVREIYYQIQDHYSKNYES